MKVKLLKKIRSKILVVQKSGYYEVYSKDFKSSYDYFTLDYMCLDQHMNIGIGFNYALSLCNTRKVRANKRKYNLNSQKP